mmetsp:Transcript_14150/g.35780  ORF Transcript_14150/g.35780 Transcript_14150/m.35780 type:complete len:211 (+) Transcript_14150:531-1163(+)
MRSVGGRERGVVASGLWQASDPGGLCHRPGHGSHGQRCPGARQVPHSAGRNQGTCSGSPRVLRSGPPGFRAVAPARVCAVPDHWLRLPGPALGAAGGRHRRPAVEPFFCQEGRGGPGCYSLLERRSFTLPDAAASGGARGQQGQYPSWSPVAQHQRGAGAPGLPGVLWAWGPGAGGGIRRGEALRELSCPHGYWRRFAAAEHGLAGGVGL